MTTWSTGVGGGPHLTAAHSAKQDMCQDALYSKTYHTNHERHVVSIYVCPLRVEFLLKTESGYLRDAEVT